LSPEFVVSRRNLCVRPQIHPCLFQVKASHPCNRALSGRRNLVSGDRLAKSLARRLLSAVGAINSFCGDGGFCDGDGTFSSRSHFWWPATRSSLTLHSTTMHRLFCA
jgi:hypothetical protein